MAFKANTTRPRVSSRTKNIARSLGYMVIDVGKDLNPTIARIHSDTKTMLSDVKTSMREMNSNSLSQATKELLDPNGQNVVNNLINDFKTGNWYNKEREDNAFFDDADFDFGGDEDWGDDEQSSSSDSDYSDNSFSSSLNGMKNLSGSIAVSMGKTSAASAEYIAKNSRVQSQAIYSLTRTGFNNISTILLNINTKMDTMIEMQQPMIQQAQNTFVFQTKASEFFDSTTDKLNSISSNLELLVENTKVLNASAGGSKYKSKGLDSLLFGDEFSLSSYFDLVKENIQEQTSLYKGLLDMGGMMYGKNGKNISPIAVAMTGAMKLVIPDVVKESIKGLNDTLEGAIPALIDDLGKRLRKSGGFFGGLLADIFLPQTKMSTTINTGNYNKGPVAWDGVARKSLVEVIPTYLAKIYAQMGGSEKYFDYESGKFVSLGAIRQKESKIKSDAINSSVRGAVSSNVDMNAVISYMSQAIEDGGKFDAKELKSLGLTNGEISKLKLAVYKTRGGITSAMKREEERGHSIYNYSQNDFGSGQKDKWGLSSNEYLHGIYQTVGNIYGLIASGAGSGTGIGVGAVDNVFDVRTGKIISAKQAELANRLRAKYSQEDVEAYRNKKGEKSNMDDRYSDEYLDQLGIGQSEYNRKKQQEEASKKIKEGKGKIKGFFSKKRDELRDRHRRKYASKHSDYNISDATPWEKPLDSFANMIDTMTDGITDLFYGDHEDEGGIIGALKNRITNAFKDFMKNNSLVKAMKETMSNIFGKVKEFGGGVISGVQEAFSSKGKLDRAANKYATKQKKQYVRAIHKVDSSGKNHYYLVDKEGNLIEVPRTKIKYAGIPVEDEVDDVTVPQHANGTRRVAKTGIAVVSEGELIIPSEYNPFYKGTTNKSQQMRKEQRIADNYMGSYANGNLGSTAKDFAYGTANTTIDGVSKFFSAIMGNTTSEGIKKDREKLNNVTSKVFKEMGLNKGAMGVGAIAGAGLSLVSGAFLGPIAGAAIGAGVGLLSKSKTMQKMVFGEITEDEDGNEVDNRTVIGKAKDAITGQVEKLLKSQGFKNVAGGAVLGAATGLIGGPFGILGGAAAGAAAGLLTTTEGFKKFMFGEDGNGEDENSFTGLIRTRVVKNLDGIFHNTWNMLKGWGTRFLTDVSDKIGGALKGFIEKLKNGDYGIFSRIFGGAINLGEKALKAPLKMIGSPLTNINKALEKRNIAKGYSSYDSVLGRNLTARERMGVRRDQGISTIGKKGDYADFDTALANITNKEDLDALMKSLGDNAESFTTKEGAVVDLTKFSRGRKKSLIDLVKDEKNNRDWDQAALEEEKQYRMNVIQKLEYGVEYLSQIADKMWKRPHKFNKHMDVETGEGTEDEESVDTNPEDDYITSNSLFGPIKTGKKTGDEAKDDNQTRESIAKREKFFSNINQLPIIGGAITGMTGLFGSIKEKLFGDGEQKKGLFDYIKDFGSKIFGENGLFAGIGQFLSGNPITGFFKTIAGNATLSTVLGGIVAPALFGAAFAGKFDNAFNTIFGKLKLFNGNDSEKSEGAFGDNTSTSITTDDGNTYQLATDESGNFITNENGEYQTTDGSYVSGTMQSTGSNNSLSSRLKKNIVTGAVRGSYGMAGAVAKGAKKSWSKMLSGTKMAKSVATNGGLLQAVMSGISTALGKLPKILNKIPFLPSSMKGEGAELIATQLYTHLDDALKGAGKSLGKIAGKVADFLPMLNIAYSVGAGINAWENAESILGITEEATFGQKCMATAIAVINSLIPFIGDLIPNNVLVNIFMSILPKVGIDVSELEDQRETAKAEVDQYNELMGTNYSIQEYNELGIEYNEETGEYEQGKSRAGIITRAKNGIKNTVTSIKEKGLGNTIKDSTIGKKVSEIGTKIKDEFVQQGEIEAKLFSLMKAGNIKDLWSADFSSIGDEDNPVNGLQKASIFAQKLQLTVPTLFIGIGKNIADTIGKVVKAVKAGAAFVSDNVKTGEEIWNNKEVSIREIFNFPEDTENSDNPLSGFMKAAAVYYRIVGAVGAIFKNIGGAIKNKISNMVSAIKGEIYQNREINDTIEGYVKTGDVTELWNADASGAESEDNPINGFQKGLIFANKLIYTVPTLLVGVGKKIKGAFDTIKTKISKSIINIGSNINNIQELASSGSVSDLVDYDAEESDEDNPLTGFQSALINIVKISNLPSAGLHWVGNKIKDAWSSFTDPVKTDMNNISSAISNMGTAASSGNVNGVRSQTFTGTSGISGLFNVAFGISRFVFTIQAFAKKFGGSIKDAFGSLLDKVGNVKDTVAQTVSSGVSTVGNWVADRIDSVKNSGGGSGTFVSQNDPNLKNRSFAGSTFGEKGCGPSVASMTANALGKNLSVETAINKSKRYQTGSGVDANYFKEALGSAGIGTSYMKGKNVKQQVLSSLAQGNKVILLGRNATNSSKDNSPFGPTNHYVLATGYDKSGIIINDPESGRPTKYSWDILNSVKMGIGASKMSKAINTGNIGMSGLTGGKGKSATTGTTTNTASSIEEQIYAFFTNNGFSPAAAAGIMGNAYAESGLDPTAIQGGGKGPAAGLFQWENYNTKSSRWKSLYDFAKSRGKDWTDLDSQLNFALSEINTNDIAKRISGQISPSNLTKVGAPTGVTMDQFKSTDDPELATKLFEGAYERAGIPNMDKRIKAAVGYYNKLSGSNWTYTGSTGTTASTTSSDSGSTFQSGLFNVISNISSLFSQAFGGLLNSSSSDTSGTTDTSTGSVNWAGNSPTEIMKSILGKISYSMSGPRNPEKGSADCSSTVQWAIKKAGGPDIGGNTGAQYNSDKLTTIWHNGGSYADTITSNAQPNDVMFFARPGGGSDKGASLDHVGHVGLYLGDNQYIDHGSGMGPKIKDFKGTSSKLIKISRVSGSNMSGSGSGLLSGISAGDSGMFNTVGSTGDLTQQVRSIIQTNNSSSGINPNTVNKLLEALAGLLGTIADNTSPIEKIYQALIQIANSGGSSGINNTTKPITTSSSKVPRTSSELDSNIIALVGTLAELAKG